MDLDYNIVYSAENTYENLMNDAFWQFLILPFENDSQTLVKWSFRNSHNIPHHTSINGLGFKTLQIRPTKPFSEISFELSCSLLKSKVNPFDFIPDLNLDEVYGMIGSLSFKVKHENYLRKTALSTLPRKYESLYTFDLTQSIFENLQRLNHWVYVHLFFKVGVTDVDTPLEEIIGKRHGVCQDFTHLFCAIAKENGIPARYVSGYIHQGNNYFGDLQMHAWAEAYVPETGWVGFDPTNDLLVAENHIKVCHGKDYNDCAPLKGIVYGPGRNETKYSVTVQSAQQQQ